MNRSILNIAHRGASGRLPENTVAAFLGAIDEGAAMCELDVQITRDGAVVVIHDDTVDRTTNGHGKVAEMTLAEIKRLDAGSGERIPTLDEVLAATAGRCALNIELKEAGCETEVLAAMRKWNALGGSMVSSFDWSALEMLRKLDPAVRIGVLAEKDSPAMLERAVRLNAVAVNPRYDLVTPDLCAVAHARGLMVLAWTVDVPEMMRMLVGYGVDGIMTNYPGRLRDVLSE